MRPARQLRNPHGPRADRPARARLTQEQLAARVGVDEGTIVDLERGRRSTSARTRLKIRTLLPRP